MTIQRPIDEETKKPEPPQTVRPTGGAATSAPSVDALSRVKQQPIQTVQQSADANPVTLQAIKIMLSQQQEELKEIRLDLHS